MELAIIIHLYVTDLHARQILFNSLFEKALGIREKLLLKFR